MILLKREDNLVFLRFNVKGDRGGEIMMRRSAKIGWFVVFFLGILMMTQCRGFISSFTKPRYIFTRVTPPSTTTISSLVPITDAVSYDDEKFYLYSDPNRVMDEVTMEISSALTPNRLTGGIEIVRNFPQAEKRYQLDKLIALRKKFVALSIEEPGKLFVFSEEGKLISQIKRDFGSTENILLAPYQEDQFWLVDKNKGKIYIMNTSGETIFSTSVVVKIDGEEVSASQFEEIECPYGNLFVRTSADHIFEYFPRENIAVSRLKGLSFGEIVDFTVDSLDNLFIAYRSYSKDQSKLVLAVKTSGLLKEFHEEPWSAGSFLKLIAYKGFLIVIDEQKYVIYPTRSLLENLPQER